MPHIPLEDHLPGITGLLEYRKDSAQPIRELTQLLLRGPSTLTEGERELIATIVSHGNECKFCTTAHTAAADKLLGECETTQAIKKDIESAPINEKMKALLVIAKQVQQSGKNVTAASVVRAKDAGATDIETPFLSQLFSASIIDMSMASQQGCPIPVITLTHLLKGLLPMDILVFRKDMII
jgi:uncharacterized peroxidase-related enzyme